ncbi:hypothetical protein [Parasulfitobacter algicola]|uniref:Uncharacterized protein n=1 Tax=Parasulfitobacter algicola TaxID=2614809 RepID=A0ABX2ITR1_9RHOB|nr:hypothetical protein [Sulfitobacter algicola]NSX53438.1 hypothetical protein [Sulfitobacter algicola]
MTNDALQIDHHKLDDTRTVRRYFQKFSTITTHLTRVAATMEVERRLSKADVAILGRYLAGLTFTFRALSNKYLFSGRIERAGQLTFDRHESGFPVFQELLTMASDAQQAERHLRNMPSVEALKDDMIRQIVGDLSIPEKLQYALSQRMYYEELMKGELFWARNDPEALWQGNKSDRRREFLVHWAVYDSQQNLPTIYLMEVEDTGRVALPKDQRRWPEVQSHLMAQSFAGLKLVTIAQGFDQDFSDLHPKRLRRFHLGPMYSHAFTRQSGPIRQILEQARAPEGQDWALVWTSEELLSKDVRREKSGFFGSVEREVFALDPFAAEGSDSGATKTERSIILPQRPYQALEEQRPPGFADVRKFVVSPQGRVLSYR